jgi:hypothetical protein
VLAKEGRATERVIKECIFFSTHIFFGLLGKIKYTMYEPYIHFIFVGMVHHIGLSLGPHVSYRCCTIPLNMIGLSLQRIGIVL